MCLAVSLYVIGYQLSDTWKKHVYSILAIKQNARNNNQHDTGVTIIRVNNISYRRS